MAISFRFQLLVPLFVSTTLLAGLWFEERHARLEQAHLATTWSSTLDTIHGALGLITARHQRTVRRARETLGESAQNRAALLAWSSGHYLSEMERLVDDARAMVSRLRVPKGPAIDRNIDLASIGDGLSGVTELAQRVGASLDSLLGSMVADDAEAIVAALTELDAADTEMLRALEALRDQEQRLDKNMHHYLSRAPTHPWESFGAVAVIMALLCAGWIVVAVFWHHINLRQLLDSDPQRLPVLGLELDALRARIARHGSRQENLEKERALSDSEAERARQMARRFERELRLEKLSHDNVVNSLGASIVMSDANDALLAVNRAARETLGFGQAAEGYNLRESALFQTLKAQVPEIESSLEQVREGKSARFESMELALPERTLIADISLVPNLDEGGVSRGIIWVVDDVTETVSAKNRLLAAEHLAAVGRLSSQVAHEIRNPLSAIGLNAELLEEELTQLCRVLEEKGAIPAAGTASGAPDEADASKTADTAQEAQALLTAIGVEIERLSQVTEGYLELARMPHPEIRETDLNQVVSDLLSMLRERLRHDGITVDLRLSEHEATAAVDPGQIRQALLNIIRNATEALHEAGRKSGTLHIACVADAQAVLLTVQDDGPGVAEDVLPRVFEPFYTTKPSGTGLGLSLTKQIVDEHGGEILVERATPEGTRVSIKLLRT